MLRSKKIPKEDKPFTRRTRPTPQASRLLFVSMMTGVILIIVLAIVFIPRALDWEGRQPPHVTLIFSESPEWRVNVTAVSKEAAASSFAVEVLRGDAVAVNRTSLPSLGPEITYRDSDGDGNLSRGDAFLLALDPAASYTFRLYHTPSGAVIGYLSIP